MKSLTDLAKDYENQKRKLEDTVDQLNEENAKLKVQGKSPCTILWYSWPTVCILGKVGGGGASDGKALESELESHREAHAKQVATLRDEIAEKNKTIEQLRM